MSLRCRSARKALRQLATDRPGADDGQPARQFGQREYGLVGVDSQLRARPGIGGSAARAPVAITARLNCRRLAVDFDACRADERAVADEDIDAQLAESLGRVVMADAGAQLRACAPSTAAKSICGCARQLDAERRRRCARHAPRAPRG